MEIKYGIKRSVEYKTSDYWSRYLPGYTDKGYLFSGTRSECSEWLRKKSLEVYSDILPSIDDESESLAMDYGKGILCYEICKIETIEHEDLFSSVTVFYMTEMI